MSWSPSTMRREKKEHISCNKLDALLPPQEAIVTHWITVVVGSSATHLLKLCHINLLPTIAHKKRKENSILLYLQPGLLLCGGIVWHAGRPLGIRRPFLYYTLTFFIPLSFPCLTQPGRSSGSVSVLFHMLVHMLVAADDAALVYGACLMELWSVNVPTCRTFMLLVEMQDDSCTKLFVYHLPSSMSQPVCLWPVHLPQQKTVEPSLNVHPPPPLHPSGWSAVSLSHLLPSSYSTDHACSKNRSHFHPWYKSPPPSPPLPRKPLHRLSLSLSLALPPFQIQAFSWVSVQVHHLTSPLLHPELHPHTPYHEHTRWNLEACNNWVPTNHRPCSHINPWTCMHLFALSVSPALLNWRVPHV